MRDVKLIFERCCDMLAEIGIDPHREKCTSVTVSKRMTRCYGNCTWNKQTKSYSIKISFRLLDENVPEHTVEDTMIHEILHGITPGAHHGGEWLRLAAVVQHKLGYNIKRRASSAESGVDLSIGAKYVLVCTECGHKYPHQRPTNSWKYPGLYRCGVCHGGLRRA